MSKCDCYYCEYCKNYKPLNTKGSFICGHPDQLFIIEYFDKNKIRKMHGFIGFGDKFKGYPSNKTTPKWCPKINTI